MSGTFTSKCKVPCTTLLTTIEEGQSGSIDESMGENWFWLKFINDVEVEETTVDPVDIMISLNFLGSNLGLLPGMGLFQLLEGFVSLIILYKVYNFCICNNR